MIAMQTKALFVDAYRDLNARKLFWVVLVLNALVVGGFATIGVWKNHITILGWAIPQEIPLAQFAYKWIFSYVIVGRWLTWGATILALISTASIFPDFMAGGAIDLYLSKPIGRLRLFLTKYISGLLFVLLQVTVFTVSSFFVLGWRGHTWEPGLFLAIPIVVLFFSYLFCICVLFGVLTRSTLTSFFLTLVAWFMIFGINQADSLLMQADDLYRERSEQSQRRLVALDQRIADMEKRVGEPLAATQPGTQPGTQPMGGSILSWFVPAPSDAQQLARMKAERGRAAESARADQPPGWVKTAQPIVFGINTMVPKTQDTIGLLDRVLFTDTAMKLAATNTPQRGPMHGWRDQMQRLLHGRSIVWILGSSMGFEVVVLALAAWQFSRRDY